MTDLWADQRRSQRARAEPLPARMRPQCLEDVAGQEHLLGPGKLLRRMIEADRLTSAIFYGPPGTGKTAVAELIASRTDRHFERANAAAIGVREIRRVLDDATRRLEDEGRKTILFLDEIHRFSRAQQDVLLQDVEHGTITLIGATTENPFFAVNSPLVSRSQIFRFHPLAPEAIKAVVRRAIADPSCGYGDRAVDISEDALDHWATVSDGDARRALAALEIAVHSGGKEEETAGPIRIDREVAEESIQQKAIDFDPTGDTHYDTLSALIKSMRGSDPDAAIYWLARLIEAGEDPMVLARRIAILASEDIGNADPDALQVAAAAYTVTERVGLPECQLTLAQAVTYMATAPKSNAATVAIHRAREDVTNQRTIPVPKHLRDTHYAGAAWLGHGEGYQYAHDHPGGWVDQDYLGVDRSYYEPTDRGYEAHIRQGLASVRERRRHGGSS